MRRDAEERGGYVGREEGRDEEEWGFVGRDEEKRLDCLSRRRGEGEANSE